MIYIYGAGKRGVFISFLLKEYEITVSGFIDVDEEKIGSKINGIKCFSLEEIYLLNRGVTIIISNKQVGSLYEKISSYVVKSRVLIWDDIKDIFPIKCQPIRDEEDLRRKIFEIHKIVNTGDIDENT